MLVWTALAGRVVAKLTTVSFRSHPQILLNPNFPLSPHTMRAALISLSLAIAANGLWAPTSGNDQLPFDVVPEGFNVDLRQMRLVQFAESESPVWISELEKVCSMLETFHQKAGLKTNTRPVRSRPRRRAEASSTCT